ncbi:hypothetical protein E2C01_064009 [Portunus trituberculatus]|uniref:Uncharacterized protein n=1 Tax=Portunus trituberculatus TaxID=210409 RepID=A0A5B7HKK7_PORTR|nr:hypothetical protein [Portunus trituberculatus]
MQVMTRGKQPLSGAVGRGMAEGDVCGEAEVAEVSHPPPRPTQAHVAKCILSHTQRSNLSRLHLSLQKIEGKNGREMTIHVTTMTSTIHPSIGAEWGGAGVAPVSACGQGRGAEDPGARVQLLIECLLRCGLLSLWCVVGAASRQADTRR